MEKNREQQKEILLVPLGKVLMDILEEIAVAVRKTYKAHVRIGRSEEPDTAVYSDERRQFDGEKLLDIAAGRKRDNLLAVLGVVDADMFAGDKTFVFSLNRPERGAAVLALSRLREEFYKKTSKRELLFHRAVTEAVSQVGLALGLPVCTQKKCVLQATSSLWRLDEKGETLCSLCQEQLQIRLFSGKSESSSRTPTAPESASGEPQTP